MMPTLRQISLPSVSMLLLAGVLFACGPAPSGAPQDTPPTEPDSAAASPGAVDPQDLDALRALPYAGGAGAADPNLQKVTVFDPQRSFPGYNLVVIEEDCAAELISPRGKVVHRWEKSPCAHWGHAELLEDNTLLVIATEGKVTTERARSAAAKSDEDEVDDEDAEEAESTPGSSATGRKSRVLMKLNWDGGVLWKRQLRAHHEMDVLPDGRIAVLTSRRRWDESIHPTARIHDNRIQLLSADGEKLESASILDLLRSQPERFQLQKVEAREKEDGVESIGLLHCNGLEWLTPSPELAAEDALYSPDNLLLTCRHQDVVAIIDWPRRELLWAWGQGEISGPHDATLLDNGHVLLFDNGLGRGWSRVVEIDPRTDEIVWEYRAPELYTIARGSSQRLPNGNTLLAESEDGRALEVTPDGEVVWEYYSPHVDDDGQRAILPKIRRLAPDRVAQLPRGSRS
ncbi:MAG: arylsulfotransferase family protein [Acidobacteriota bacterium]|nr:arylsulfotransferase family protein [Acidobacteriota bacterium]